MRGRKPKPTALKQLAGNPGKRRLNHTEPKPEPGVTYCPRQLSPEAKAEWRRMAHQLQALGLMTKLDRAALAAYCQAWANFVRATKALEKADWTVDDDKPNPWIGIQEKAMNQMRRYLTEFGLSPSSRSRLKVDTGDQGPTLADMLFDLAKDK